MERMGRVDMLLELLEGDPRDVFLNYALGIEYASVNNSGDAESQFRKVLEIDPEYLPVYYQLGKLMERLGRNPAALTHYKCGLEKARLSKDKSAGEFEEAIFMLED